MNPSDFVFKHIFSGALNAGASQHLAHSHAVMGLADYKRGKIPKSGGVGMLIQNRIAMAKKATR